jgi:DNA-directed RNA polymerase alpha subunit
MKPIQGNPVESNLPAKLANPARRALLGAGYTQIEQLSEVSQDDLMQLHGIGAKAIQHIRQALAERGLSLAGESSRTGGEV